MNIKKCLITIVSGILITAVTHGQEASEDLTAEQHQLAQLKAELDAREKALDRREKMLAEKERATASSTSPSREKGKAKGQTGAGERSDHGRTSESCACRNELHEPFAQRLEKRFKSSLAPPLTRARTRVNADSASYSTVRRSIRHLTSADWQTCGTQIIGDPVSFHRIH
jgi:hypothetical protein